LSLLIFINSFLTLEEFFDYFFIHH